MIAALAKRRFEEIAMSVLEQIGQALIDGKHTDVGALTEQALGEGLGAQQILDEGLLAGMEVISERFRNHEIFLPSVLLAARAMYAGLDLIEPHLEGSAVTNKGTVVIGTVEGDLHDIGKNLVGILLRAAGFEVVDLGKNVAPAQFIEAARKHDAKVVGMSALLTTTMPAMAAVVAGLKTAGLTEVKTIVGGAPLSDEFAGEIGADAYGYDAARAAAILQSWAQ
jgi:5-methyltetrahydrofolate--homocysteine methyltransferase